MRRSKSVYHNDKQLQFLKAKQPIRALVWGRGTGKSTCIGSINYIKMMKLPRAKVFFSSSTYNQILTKTLPAIESKWMELGLKEDIHWVLGKIPPKHFVKPYSPPRKYDNVISFWNGYTIEFLSMDRPDLSRGGSYDGGDIDEAALVPQEHFQKVILPSIRGNLNRFSHHLHQNVNLYTSQPWKASGMYILNYKEKAEEDPDRYFYSEANAYDNLLVLGKNYVQDMKRELTPETFELEILNHAMRRVPDGFYVNFRDTHHTYSPDFIYKDTSRGPAVSGTKDVNRKEQLNASFDFGGWFSCASIWQTHGKEERCVNAFHVKEDQKVDDLVDKICYHYTNHSFKRVLIWGEPRGHDRSAVGDTIYNQVERRFAYHGWTAKIMVKPGQRTTTHEQRHYFINDLLSEHNKKLPVIRINEDACKDMIYAIMMTSIRSDFRKDKERERDRNFPQEHATHYTDGMDYYLVQKYFVKARTGMIGPGEAVMFS